MVPSSSFDGVGAKMARVFIDRNICIQVYSIGIYAHKHTRTHMCTHTHTVGFFVFVIIHTLTIGLFRCEVCGGNHCQPKSPTSFEPCSAPTHTYTYTHTHTHTHTHHTHTHTHTHTHIKTERGRGGEREIDTSCSRAAEAPWISERTANKLPHTNALFFKKRVFFLSRRRQPIKKRQTL